MIIYDSEIRLCVTGRRKSTMLTHLDIMLLIEFQCENISESFAHINLAKIKTLK